MDYFNSIGYTWLPGNRHNAWKDLSSTQPNYDVLEQTVAITAAINYKIYTV